MTLVPLKTAKVGGVSEKQTLCGKPKSRRKDAFLGGLRGLVAHTELADGSKVRRSSEEGDRGGQGLITGQIAIDKGKAVPLQAWIGPEGSRKLRFPDFMITAQDGGKVVSLTHQPPLSPGNDPGTHFC